MRLDDIQRRIQALDAASEHAADRFDGPAAHTDRLAVLPSAFNPPTRAHLSLMRIAARRLGASPAALLTTRNVAKGVEGAPLEHRVGMLLAARSEEPGLVVLVSNAARFVDQARALRRSMPGTAVDFVAGYDTLVRLFDRKYYDDMEPDLDELFSHHRLVATNRGADSITAVDEFVARVPQRHAQRIVRMELPPDAAALSSTLARQTIDGDAVGITGPVRRYIEDNGLYREI